jgi:hypothetical protein
LAYWQRLDQWQQWALGICCSLVAAGIVWLCTKLFGNRKGKDSGVTVRQNSSPTVAQTFQPAINIHPPRAASAETMFQAIQERNILSKEEAEDRRLNQLEQRLHQLIVAVKLIHSESDIRCAEKIRDAVADIAGFFRTFPELQHLNIALLKELCSDDFPRAVRQAAISVWAQAERRSRGSAGETGGGIEHPCDLLVSGIVNQLLSLRVRPCRTMKDYEDSLPT